MDLQSEAVARTVEEPLHPAVLFSGLVPFLLEIFLDLPVDLRTVRSLPDPAESDLLGALHQSVYPLQFLRCTAPHDRPGDVPAVPCAQRSGEYIYHHRLIGPYGAGSLVVGIARLIPHRDDGVPRHTVVLHQPDVDQLLHAFRGQNLTVTVQTPSPDVRRSDRVHGRVHRVLRMAQRFGDVADLLLRFQGPFLEERLLPEFDRVPLPTQKIRRLDPERGRHKKPPHLHLLQDQVERVERGRLLDVPLHQHLEILRQREHSIGSGLGLRPIDLQVIQQQRPDTVLLDIHERIRCQEPTGVVYIGIPLTRGDDQCRVRFHLLSVL